MGVSIKRIEYLDTPFCGRAEANWLNNHFPSDSNGSQETKVHITDDNLEECLQRAKDCKGNCDFFEEGKERHDEITKEMSIKLAEMLAEYKKKNKSKYAYIDLEVWW